jgi:hypothetical protein
MPDIRPLVLFRLSVLGPLVSRGRLGRGELKALIRELAQRDYDIPGGRRSRIGEKTIESCYYRSQHVRRRRQGLCLHTVDRHDMLVTGHFLPPMSKSSLSTQ